MHLTFPPPRKLREKRSRLVFVLNSPTQREIFIRSYKEMERLRGVRREERRVDEETDRRGANRVCVSPYVSVYLPAHSSVTKHDERTSLCWQIMAVLRSSRQH